MDSEEFFKSVFMRLFSGYRGKDLLTAREVP
jgi:hypothetical protein